MSAHILFACLLLLRVLLMLLPKIVPLDLKWVVKPPPGNSELGNRIYSARHSHAEKTTTPIRHFMTHSMWRMAIRSRS